MNEHDVDSVTNYDLLQKLIRLSDAIQSVKDTQAEQAKLLGQILHSFSDVSGNIADISERLTDH